MRQQRVLAQTSLLPVFFFLGAFVVRLLIGGDFPVLGDELSSLQEARNIGQNFQGLPYFLVLRIWLLFGDAPLWARIPSILFGSLAVAVCWLWLRQLTHPAVALLASVLLLLSPVAISVSVEIRYYSLFLLACLLFFWRYWAILTHEQRTARHFISLILAGLLLAFSQLLGSMIIVLVGIHALIHYRHRVPRPVLLILLGAGVLLVGALLLVILRPDVLREAYAVFSRVIASQANAYEGPRGFRLVTFAKLGLLLHGFTLGPAVYPFSPLAVLGLMIFLLAAVVGLLVLFRSASRSEMTFALIVGLGGVVAVYVFLEALLPPSFRDSADPKTVVFALPIFLWLAAESIQPLITHQRRLALAAMVLVAVQAGAFLGLVNDPERPDLNDVTAQIVSPADANPVTVFADGRSEAIWRYYLRHTDIPIQSAWPDQFRPERAAHYATISAADDRETIRCTLQSTLSHFADRRLIYQWVSYPNFVYTYDTLTPAVGPELPLPRSLYGPQFADLPLPQRVRWEERELTIGGMYPLPTCTGAMSWTANNMQGMSGTTVSTLVLFSNLLFAEGVEDGTAIGQITITGQNGTRLTFDVRKGYETQAWNQACIDTCREMLRWHKQIALVGAAAYPYAHNDLQASIWGAAFDLRGIDRIDSVEIVSLNAAVQWNLWGLYALSPD